MKRFILSVVTALSSIVSFSQSSYEDSLKLFIKNYVDKHEVVTGDDRKLLGFYPVNKNYQVVADFERVRNGKWFSMETSGSSKQTFRVYGIIRFKINDTVISLNLYQSQMLMAVPEYKDDLFLPFTDLTSGHETYAGGRYVDLTFNDILGNKVVIDFNKAYNPYCAYVSGKYNCPIPPRENMMKVAIRAGEKAYGKSH
ncbi:MAG TPA: DUF1684 domain-containing protein [Chitinophagaceae bacterium]|nr:DUF1684 domain-containing protein [Chitinophagaceae bacterium]